MKRTSTVFGRKAPAHEGVAVQAPPAPVAKAETVHTPSYTLTPVGEAMVEALGAPTESDEMTLREFRHKIYDFITSIGGVGMGVGEVNRGVMANMLKEYGVLRTRVLTWQIRQAQRTAAERNKQRKEAAARKKADRMAKTI